MGKDDNMDPADFDNSKQGDDVDPNNLDQQSEDMQTDLGDY